MLFSNVYIEGISSYLPNEDEGLGETLSSEALEVRLSDVYEGLKLPFGRLELMTGIKERKLWPTKTRPSDLATKAANKCIEKFGIEKSDIDQLIHASVCRDFLEPSTASVVHHNLGLKSNSMIFDLSNACLGVVSSMTIAAQLIETGAIKKCLIVSGENGGPLVEQTIQTLKQKYANKELTRKNIKKYLANLTIGSAAIAVCLSHKDYCKNPKALQILSSTTQTDSSANILCSGDGDTSSLMMETDSEALMHAGIALAKETWKSFQEELPINFDYVVTHQVGVAHEKLTLESLGLSNTKTERTYPELGNTGSAALPITLLKLIDNHEILPGQKIGLLGIGSGLTSTMMSIKC